MSSTVSCFCGGGGSSDDGDGGKAAGADACNGIDVCVGGVSIVKGDRRGLKKKWNP